MFGDAARDILDPKLRGGVGRYGVKASKAARRTGSKRAERAERPARARRITRTGA